MQHGLTAQQLRTSIAAHELGHAMVAAALPTTRVLRVTLGHDHGGTYVAAEGDPIEKAAVTMGGSTAGETWLRTVGGVSSYNAMMLSRDGSRADDDKLRRLGLSGSDDRRARQMATDVLNANWASLLRGALDLARSGRMSERQVGRLVGGGGSFLSRWL